MVDQGIEDFQPVENHNVEEDQVAFKGIWNWIRHQHDFIQQHNDSQGHCLVEDQVYDRKNGFKKVWAQLDDLFYLLDSLCLYVSRKILWQTDSNVALSQKLQIAIRISDAQYLLLSWESMANPFGHLGDVFCFEPVSDEALRMVQDEEEMLE